MPTLHAERTNLCGAEYQPVRSFFFTLESLASSHLVVLDFDTAPSDDEVSETDHPLTQSRLMADADSESQDLLDDDDVIPSLPLPSSPQPTPLVKPQQMYSPPPRTGTSAPAAAAAFFGNKKAALDDGDLDSPRFESDAGSDSD